MSLIICQTSNISLLNGKISQTYNDTHSFKYTQLLKPACIQILAVPNKQKLPKLAVFKNQT